MSLSTPTPRTDSEIRFTKAYTLPALTLREWSPMQGVAAVATGWVPASIVHEQLIRWNRERQDWEESGKVLAPKDPAASERCWARAELMRRMITQLGARMPMPPMPITFRKT